MKELALLRYFFFRCCVVGMKKGVYLSYREDTLENVDTCELGCTSGALRREESGKIVDDTRRAYECSGCRTRFDLPSLSHRSSCNDRCWRLPYEIHRRRAMFALAVAT